MPFLRVRLLSKRIYKQLFSLEVNPDEGAQRIVAVTMTITWSFLKRFGSDEVWAWQSCGPMRFRKN
jgi:hypothetical protein